MGNADDLLKEIAALEEDTSPSISTADIDRGVAYAWTVVAAADGKFEQEEARVILTLNAEDAIISDNASLVKYCKEASQDLSEKGIDFCLEIIKNSLNPVDRKKKHLLLDSLLKISVGDREFGSKEKAIIAMLIEFIDIKRIDVVSSFMDFYEKLKAN